MRTFRWQKDKHDVSWALIDDTVGEVLDRVIAVRAGTNMVIDHNLVGITGLCDYQLYNSGRRFLTLQLAQNAAELYFKEPQAPAIKAE